MIVISDIEGNIDLLRQIENKYPKRKIICAGDFIDRGKNSKLVLDFFMEKDHIVIMGNHEYLFLDFILNKKEFFYDTWLRVGGKETISSFIQDEKENKIFNNLVNILIDNCNNYEKALLAYNSEDDLLKIDKYKKLKKEIKQGLKIIRKKSKKYVDKKYIKFLKKLPTFYEDEKYFISHAPISETMTLDQFKQNSENKEYYKVLFNRYVSNNPKEKIMIFGHNSQKEPKEYKKNSKVYAINIENSKEKDKQFFYDLFNHKISTL